mmetsp:Transcript_12285/g.22293  ORF Transcript_12285/g.22293 Transcript_12285/m.22293 type:complete len:190 (-) Transcript_12285:257-826(-)
MTVREEVASVKEFPVTEAMIVPVEQVSGLPVAYTEDPGTAAVTASYVDPFYRPQQHSSQAMMPSEPTTTPHSTINRSGHLVVSGVPLEGGDSREWSRIRARRKKAKIITGVGTAVGTSLVLGPFFGVLVGIAAAQAVSKSVKHRDNKKFGKNPLDNRWKKHREAVRNGGVYRERAEPQPPHLQDGHEVS